MRREKEIAESRYELAQGDSLRYRLRVEHLERELKEVQDRLNAAKERMQVCFYFLLTITNYVVNNRLTQSRAQNIENASCDFMCLR